MRMILPTEPTAKLSRKPSQWRFVDGETDHLTNREVFDKEVLDCTRDLSEQHYLRRRTDPPGTGASSVC